MPQNNIFVAMPPMNKNFWRLFALANIIINDNLFASSSTRLVHFWTLLFKIKTAEK